MPKIVDHNMYRGELLTNCYNLFSKRGYSSATMRDIARELGVSTGTLYHYFPTKKSILEQMFRMVSQRHVTEVVSRIVEDDSPIEEKLKILFNFVAERESHFQDLLLLVIEYFRHHESEDAMEIMKETARFYGTEIAENLKVDPQLGSLIFVFLIGLVYHCLVFPEVLSFQKQTEIFRDMLLEYVKR